MNYEYLQSGDIYKSVPKGSALVSQLGTGIYTLKKSPEGLYLQKYADQFPIENVTYDVTNGLSNRIIAYWKNEDKSCGILFTGEKGCGKSYTAKIIANALNLPVIVITEFLEGLQEFISNLSGEAMIIFDEFEKIFNNYDYQQNTLLTITDGILSYSKENRKLFVFTANDESLINENFFNRPGRIRYRMNFSGISKENVEKIVYDMVCDEMKHKKSEIINMLTGIDNLTIDIVKEIIREINIFGFDKETIERYLNIKFKYPSYNLYVKRNNMGISGAYIEDEEYIHKYMYSTELKWSPETITKDTVIDGVYGKEIVVENNILAERSIIITQQVSGSMSGTYNWYFFAKPVMPIISKNILLI